MAKATVDARKMADQVKTEVVTARQQRRNELVRHLFGIAPGDGGILTMRDAADRANKIETPAAAGTALRQAQLAGDHSMAKAIAHHAVTNSWTGIVSEYVDALPLAESTPTALALQELSAIPHGANTDLADSAVFSVRSPRELFAYRDGDLSQLAEDAAPEGPPQLLPTTAW